jgi:poly(3-hydroxybutyrate) depolymerase
LALASPSPVPAADGLTPGVLIDRVPLTANPEESYALYLPSGYSPDRPAPILYGFDPRARGRVPVERFQAAAERYGWIVVGSNASRNGIAVGDIIGRLWGDTHARIAIDSRRVYATGFSGGARVASGMGLASRDQVAGVIAFGAGLPSGARLPKDVGVLFFAGAGLDDFNLPEMRQLAADLDGASIPNRLETWDGGHEWAPAEVCTLALEWLELGAMRNGLRPKDEALVERWARRDEDRARQHESGGTPVEAARAFDSLAADFRGLRETTAYAESAMRLRATRAYKDALKAQRDDEYRQGHFADELGAAIRVITGEAEGPATALSSLRSSITDLRRSADKADGGREAHVARRVLAGAWIQALEASNALRARKEYRRAADALAVAGEVRPLTAGQLYELARLHSLSGDTRQAIQDLSRAIDNGFSDVASLQSEPDLERVRRSPEFAALVSQKLGTPKTQ